MYIDGVFSGGGIKGLALVGACAAIEEQGFRFKRVAGTSAGSIIAGLLAAGYTSAEMADILDGIDLKKLLDPRKTFFPSALTKWLFVYWRLGLYKGDELECWIEEVLAARGLRTFGDLVPGCLRIIASDLTNGRILVLPDDLPKYGIDPLTFPVAKAIRMSSSLPFFFEPVKLRDRVGTNIVVDGGVLSNFPMWLFDQEKMLKMRPVLGVKLSQNLMQQPKKNIKNALQLFDALFDTMKDAHDSRYISRKHEKNIIFIPMEESLTTEFQLTDEKKQELIKLGKNSAEKFFKSWHY